MSARRSNRTRTTTEPTATTTEATEPTEAEATTAEATTTTTEPTEATTEPTEPNTEPTEPSGVEPFGPTEADKASDASASAKQAETAKKKAENDKAEEVLPTVAPFGAEAEEEPSAEAETEAVREDLSVKAEEAESDLTNAAVSYGYRLARLVMYGRFPNRAEAWQWIADRLGTNRSRASQYVQAYRVAVETPSVAEAVRTVDGLVFLSRFSSEDREVIVSEASEAVGPVRSLPVSALSESAETVDDEYHAEQEKRREAEAKAVVKKAEREAKKAEAKALAEKKKADAKADGAEADGAAIVTASEKSEEVLAKEKQEAYNGLRAKNTLQVLSEAVAFLDNGGSAETAVRTAFRFGLLLGGGYGPQSVLAWDRLQAEEKAEAEKAEAVAEAVTAEVREAVKA